MNPTVFSGFPDWVCFVWLLLVAWLFVLLHVVLWKLKKYSWGASDDKIGAPNKGNTGHDEQKSCTPAQLHSDISQICRQQESILKDLKDLRTILADKEGANAQAAQVQDTINQPTSRSKEDSESELRSYLRQYYGREADLLWQLILDFPRLVSNDTACREAIIRCAVACDFANLSERRSLEFCEKVNEVLQGNQVEFFCPKVSERYDPEKMVLNNQYSDSSRISSVIYFGISFHNQVVQKAVVNVG